MKNILELLFTCFWIGILIACLLVITFFIVGLAKAFYKIYFAKNEIDQDLYNGKLN